jgi:hypothetical protein
MKGFLAIALMVALAFAGCAGKSNSTSTTTSATSSTSTTSATTTHSSTTTATSTTTHTTTTSSTTTSSSSTSSGPNHPPTVNTFTASRPNGTSLAFTFTFTASDPDGDTVSWTLDANSDGTADRSGASTPSSALYTYAAAGLYNATLKVSDGKSFAFQTLAVNATVAPSGPLGSASITWKVGSVAYGPYPYAPDGSGAPFNPGTPAANVLWGELAIPASWQGHQFTANFGKPGTDADCGIVSFYGAVTGTPPNAPLLDAFNSGTGLAVDVPGPKATDPMMVADSVPASSAWAMFINCANPVGATVALTVV